MPPINLSEGLIRDLAGIPTQPGCYFFKDEEGQILYVGKAVNLRSRVRSYFRKSARHGPRIERLTFKTKQIETIVTESELEALVLECNLIKQHRPPYNVRLRDDKSYPYIVVTKEKYPRVIFSRNPKRGGGKTYGPYTSAWAVRDTLGLLHKIFPLIPCGKSWSGAPERKPCLYFHIGQCLAPCAGLSDREEYGEVLNTVGRILEGKEESVAVELREQMDVAAENLEFERAAKLRDSAEALDKLVERQRAITKDEHDKDVLAVVKDERGSAIQILFIRGGKLIGQSNYMLDGSKEASPGEAVQEFVKQYYTSAPEVPREILLPVEIEEKKIVEQWLRQRKDAAVTIEVPKGGEGLRLVDMAASNAEEALKRFALEADRDEQYGEKAMTQLAELLNLNSPPSRIEGYDISNTQGTSASGSMVVSVDGQPMKSDYRRFRIKFAPERANDFLMMKEVVGRRLRRFLEGDEKFMPLPDLIMVDGGKGQLSSALAIRDELGLSVPMVGLAKRAEAIFIPIGGPEDKEYRFKEAILPMDSEALTALRRLRDEAHRFALTYHRKMRDKRMQGSELDEIPGIGPKRRRMLLRTFGSIDAIRRASVTDIASVPTLTLSQAERIKEHLCSE